MRNLYKIFITIGTMLILSALFLCIYNIRESRKAYEISQENLSELKKLIPESPKENTDIFEYEIPEDDLFAPYEEKETEPYQEKIYEDVPRDDDEESEMTYIIVNEYYYCGYISLPSLGIELPVLDGWNYPNLQISPCLYSGNPQDNNMIIAAHNYSNHFGQIEDLNSDDEIYFTDCEGKTYGYTVVNTEYIGGYDVESMFRGSENDWDLTLFTCTFDGRTRVTVRAQRINQEGK